MKLLSLLPFVLCAPLPALAQSTNYSSVEVAAGESTRLGFYGFAHKDCTSEPLPTLEVVTPPKHGVITVRSGTLTTTKITNCPSVNVQVQVVFYRANAGYAGSDQVVFGVKKQSGVVDAYSISVNVKQAAPPQPPPAKL